jgi:hypothetical protein
MIENDASHHCSQCLNDKPFDKLFRCEACQAVYYCGKACQRLDWKKGHKDSCKIKERPIVTLNDVNYMIKVIERRSGIPYNPLQQESDMMTYSNKNPLSLQYAHVEVRKSDTHGNGVFTTLALPKGVVFTFFPAHSIHRDCDENRIVSPPSSNYQISVTNGYSFIGDPERVEQPTLLGHILNDPYGNVFSEIHVEELKNATTMRDLMMRYYAHCTAKRNCRIQMNVRKTIISFITTCEVAKDVELFYVYGLFYWIRREYGFDYNEKYPFIDENYANILRSDDPELRFVMAVEFD